jgi:hypothetical protein
MQCASARRVAITRYPFGCILRRNVSLWQVSFGTIPLLLRSAYAGFCCAVLREIRETSFFGGRKCYDVETSVRGFPRGTVLHEYEPVATIIVNRLRKFFT